MIDKQQIESILRVNGLPPTAPDEEIRSVLISSRYDDDEIDTAITVLRQSTVTNKSHVEGLHKVFRTDTVLKPQEISTLLGISVDLTERVTPVTKQKSDLPNHILIWIASLSIALLGIMVYMYVTDVGLFHHTSAYKLPM